MAANLDVLYESVLARIADRTATTDDFNRLIDEALGKSVRERVNRHQRPTPVGPAAADPRPVPHRAGDNDPTRTVRGRMASRGARKERENEQQRRRVAAEADEFLQTHAAGPLAAAVTPLRAVADLPALRGRAAALLADQDGRRTWEEQHLPKGQVLRADWLYGLLRVADVLLTEEAGAVRVEQESRDVWVCPHCNDQIHEKSLYHDGTNFFHRPCRDIGPIILPARGNV